MANHIIEERAPQHPDEIVAVMGRAMSGGGPQNGKAER